MIRPSEHPPAAADGGFLRQVFDSLPAAAYTCDIGGLITYFNRSAIDVWGRAPRVHHESDRYCGSYRLFYADGSPMRHDQCWMALTIRKEQPHNGHEVLIERPDGALRSALAHANPLRDAAGRFIGAANVLVDITERKRIEDQLAHQATHDALTGLPNRALHLRRLEEAIAAASAAGRTFSLLLMDLDRFKEINDTFGHEYGDEVLRQLRPRLLAAVRPSDTVARLGGDEFGVILPGADARGGGVQVAREILARLREPMTIAGQAFDVGASIGLAEYPAHGTDSTTLLRHADLAMYESKRARSGPAIYSADPAATTARQLSISGQLRAAIGGDQLRLRYQPKVDLRSMAVVGAEALVRWEHPAQGLLLPSEFLPEAEKSGLIRDVDLWSLRQAIGQCRRWDDSGLGLGVAVNLAPESLQDPGVVDEIVGLLRGAGDLAGRLTLEITERAVMGDPSRAAAALARLRGLGARVALDDFGTGYSSLVHLKELAVDELKIDRSFLKDLPANGRDARIVRSVIDLAHDLGLVVVAEGVEGPEALAWSVANGCDLAQGYHFARPLPPEDIVACFFRDAAPAGA